MRCAAPGGPRRIQETVLTETCCEKGLKVCKRQADFVEATERKMLVRNERAKCTPRVCAYSMVEVEAESEAAA